MRPRACSICLPLHLALLPARTLLLHDVCSDCNRCVPLMQHHQGAARPLPAAVAQANSRTFPLPPTPSHSPHVPCSITKVLPGRYLLLGTQGPKRSGLVQAPPGLPEGNPGGLRLPCSSDLELPRLQLADAAPATH